MYNRTQNENGSYNSRCLDCFLTIASSVESEPELDVIEARHICPEKALSWLAAQEHAAEQQTSRS
jgi:hypothetical protein